MAWNHQDERAQPVHPMSRSEMLNELAQLGPRFETTVVVNGRRLILEAALQLIGQLPSESRVCRRYRYVSIWPDPFRLQPSPFPTADERGGLPSSQELVARLIEGQRRPGLITRLARRISGAGF